jgi:SAM-dependent methyltransferase
MSLYDEYMAEHYDILTPGLAGDVDFYAGLAREAEPPVLELGCGSGRVAIPIARAGVPIVGLDSSPAMLARARERSTNLANVRWVEADMRAFDLPERFGLVIIPYRAFQHMITVDDQRTCLGCIRWHLRDDGRLAFNLFNPDLVAMGRWLSDFQGDWRIWHDSTDERTGQRTIAWECRRYHTGPQEASVLWKVEEIDADGRPVSQRYVDLHLRWFYRFEVEHLLALTGFRVERLYGWFDGSAFGDNSPEMVWVARKASGQAGPGG